MTKTEPTDLPVPGLIGGHFSTLRVTRGNKNKKWLLWPVILFTFGLPIVAAVATWWYGVRLTAIDSMVAGVSIIAGLLFALVIFVFQLRLSITHDPRAQDNKLIPRLIDELFANVTYAVVMALVATCVLVIAANTEPISKKGTELGTEPWVSGIVVLLGLHLITVIIEALRRTRTAYASFKQQNS